MHITMTLSAPLILASASPSRKQILESANLPFDAVTPKIDEEIVRQEILNLSVSQQAIALAKAKAKSVAYLYPEALIIGSDQICALENNILHKPGSHKKAIEHLHNLSGKMHQQHSAVCLYRGQECLFEHIDIASLTMRKLSDIEIETYLQLDSPYNCAGAYKLEEHGKHLFTAISGAYETILGMPLIPLLGALREYGQLSFPQTEDHEQLASRTA